MWVVDKTKLLTVCNNYNAQLVGGKEDRTKQLENTENCKGPHQSQSSKVFVLFHSQIKILMNFNLYQQRKYAC